MGRRRGEVGWGRGVPTVWGCRSTGELNCRHRIPTCYCLITDNLCKPSIEWMMSAFDRCTCNILYALHWSKTVT